MTPDAAEARSCRTSAPQEIRDAAIDEGMLTLRMDGWLKVLKGITTLEQVIRETAALVTRARCDAVATASQSTVRTVHAARSRSAPTHQ